MKHIKRYARLIFGLFLYGFGTYLSIQANVGLAPWEAFHLGIANTLGTSFGNISISVGLVILVVDIILKEDVGIGTVLNIILIGKFVDLFSWLDLMPMLNNFWLGILLLLLGQFVICLGTYFYASAALGCGPRDALMVALGKRLKKVPIGAIRGIIEGSVLVIGWLLGSKVGLGTVIAVFGISFILQFTFRILRFDVKAVRHENIFQTLGIMKKT